MMRDRRLRSQGRWTDSVWNGVRPSSFCSFEEEQQELQKSLSKDWCDKMDNAEAEEKKLHRYSIVLLRLPTDRPRLVSCSISNNSPCTKIRPPRRFSVRSNAVRKVSSLAVIFPHRCSRPSLELLRRQKEISKGKLSKVYEAYVSAIPRWVNVFVLPCFAMKAISRKSRTRPHPRTPCKYAKMSRRGFDGAIKAWRRKLHEFGAERYVSRSKSLAPELAATRTCLFIIPLGKGEDVNCSPAFHLEAKKMAAAPLMMTIRSPSVPLNAVMATRLLHPRRWAWRTSMRISFRICTISKNRSPYNRRRTRRSRWSLARWSIWMSLIRWIPSWTMLIPVQQWLSIDEEIERRRRRSNKSLDKIIFLFVSIFIHFLRFIRIECSTQTSPPRSASPSSSFA